MSVTACVQRSLRRFTGRTGRVPTTDQLARNAMRHVAGAALVLLAAAIAHRTGHVDQQWQYVAVAAALVPQVLLDVLAVGDADRRARLRTSRRAAPVPLLAGVALGVGAAAMLLSGQSVVVAVAALCASAGLGIAAAPITVAVAPRGHARADAGA
jgi:hypothetical protein